MNIIIQEEWFSVEQCRHNPNRLYVFGDNLIRIGKGGQACIRDEINSYGIATKRTPSMDNQAFFGDRADEAHTLLNDIHGLLQRFYDGEYETIVLPKDGLGTGLAKMQEKSPELFVWLHETLSLLLDVDYRV